MFLFIFPCDAVAVTGSFSLGKCRLLWDILGKVFMTQTSPTSVM